jgi:hypothetical protein
MSESNTLNMNIRTHIENLMGTIKDILLINELYATSSAASSDLDVRNQEIVNMLDRAKSNSWKSKHTYLNSVYTIEYNRWITNIILFTFFVLMIALLIMAVALMNGRGIGSLGAWLALLFIVYACAIVVWYNGYKARTQYNWNKFYFKKPTG